VYVNATSAPFADTPPAFRNNHAAVMYVTDRAMDEGGTPEAPKYGRKRSRSVACGVCDVRFGGESVTWDQLVQASTSSHRSIKLPVEVVRTTEIVRFPPTPRVLIERTIDTPTTQPTTTEADRQAAEQACENELKARLAVSPSKEVYIYVHGVQNSFDDSVRTAAQLWHFLGRQGVVVAYSWPAGGKGLLRGYNYDYNSSEFTVYHLKQMLRVIASCPEVSKVNIIAHSRGTDSAVSALRELHLEISGSGRSTREVLKLGSVVLAAPDLDVDVVFQRLATARLGQVPERSVVYVCRNDEALGLSRFLFSSQRLGSLRPEVFTKDELVALRESKKVAIIEARVSKPGAFAHSYFYENPAVSSDLILLMRYDYGPGAENGRPLSIGKDSFWYITDKYPERGAEHLPGGTPVNAAAAPAAAGQ
jgi:esterase/lipase superfamily enzyme